MHQYLFFFWPSTSTYICVRTNTECKYEYIIIPSLFLKWFLFFFRYVLYPSLLVVNQCMISILLWFFHPRVFLKICFGAFYACGWNQKLGWESGAGATGLTWPWAVCRHRVWPRSSLYSGYLSTLFILIYVKISTQCRHGFDFVFHIMSQVSAWLYEYKYKLECQLWTQALII